MKSRGRKSKVPTRPASPLATAPGPLGQRLRRTQKQREDNLVSLRREFELGMDASNQALTWLRWIRDLCTNEALQQLIDRVSENVGRGIDAALSGDRRTVNDIGRDFMEVEVLFLDFCRNPEQVKKWAESADDHAKASAFSFRKVTDRLRAASGLPADHVLPNDDEYLAHSASLHPTPYRVTTASGSRQPEERLALLELDLIDLLQHTIRCVEALIRLADQTTFFDEPTDRFPTLDAFGAVGYVFVQRFEDMDSYVRTVLGDAAPRIRPRSPRKRTERPFLEPPRG